jgi:hypothetical protein
MCLDYVIDRADYVLRLNEDGSVFSWNEGVSVGGFIVSTKTAEQDIPAPSLVINGEDYPSQSVSRDPNPNEERQQNQQATDISDAKVYLGYFKSIGLVDGLFFLAAGISFGFTLEFPGKFSLIAQPMETYLNVSQICGLSGGRKISRPPDKLTLHIG